MRQREITVTKVITKGPNGETLREEETTVTRTFEDNLPLEQVADPRDLFKSGEVHYL